LTWWCWRLTLCKYINSFMNESAARQLRYDIFQYLWQNICFLLPTFHLKRWMNLVKHVPMGSGSTYVHLVALATFHRLLSFVIPEGSWAHSRKRIVQWEL
jgi:hypothetical protein